MAMERLTLKVGDLFIVANRFLGLYLSIILSNNLLVNLFINLNMDRIQEFQ